MSLPYFNLYPKDFEAKTSHLTLEEDGAYNRILRLMWMTPGCSLPDDDKWIMRRMRVDQDTFDRVVRVVLDEFFTASDGRVSNAKLTEEFEKSNVSHQKRVLAGSKGGKSKPLKTNETSPSNAKAKPKQPEPEPEPKKESSRDAQKYTDEFELFWKTWKAKNGGGDKAPAFDGWKKLSVHDREIAAAVAAPWFEQWRKAAPDATAIHASTYLNKRRFDGFEAPSASKQVSMAGKTVVTNADPVWNALVARKRQETGKGVNAESWAFDDAWVEQARSAPPPSTEDLERGRQMQGFMSSVSGNA